MSLWIEKQYLGLLSYRLEGFVQKSPQLFNCRCPICHDSDNPKKKRFFFYVRENQLKVYCHNCGYYSSFKNFLKKIDESLYHEFLLETLKETGKSPDYSSFKTEIPFFDDTEAYQKLLKLKNISSLPLDHPARKYIVSRKIPDYWHSVLRFCPNFPDWVNEIVPGKIEKNYAESRIIIPFFSEKKKFHAFQGRLIESSSYLERYVGIVLDKDIPFIFGLDRLNKNNDTYVFEGPIDSMFIDNAVSICGSNFLPLTNVIDHDRIVLVYDNEPHSLQTKAKIEKAINNGFRVVIFPDFLEEKDINEMILADMPKEHISWILKNNTFYGLHAKIRLIEWSKRK
jgi:hypothetical protein